MTLEQLEHQFRMLLMNEGEDYGEEILVSLISEKSAEIAKSYADEKVKEEQHKTMDNFIANRKSCERQWDSEGVTMWDNVIMNYESLTGIEQ